MKALVLYHTVFGNTERIANSLARGLRGEGIEADCVNIGAARIEKLREYDMLAVGAPTQYVTASKPMKEFLARLTNFNLKGRYGFAFDTRLDYLMAGSAAKFIEKKLKGLRIEIIRRHSSATVVAVKKGEASKSGEVVLEEGMERLFEGVGKELGVLLKARVQQAQVVRGETTTPEWTIARNISRQQGT